MHEWNWEPDDFAALWYSESNDRIPSILRYTSRFEYVDEFEAHKIAVRNRYDSEEFERIQLALHTLSNSDMRIAVLGGTSRRKNSDGTPRVYRIIGARTNFHAAVLHQFTQDDRDGRYRLRMCRPENLPTLIAQTIPARTPGQQAPITVHPAELREHRQSRTGNTPAERYRRLLAPQGEGGGSARLLVGAFNTDPKPVNVVQWYDVEDGRYLELHGEHITVRPAAARDLADRFAGWIDTAVRRIREYEEEYERW